MKEMGFISRLFNAVSLLCILCCAVCIVMCCAIIAIQKWLGVFTDTYHVLVIIGCQIGDKGLEMVIICKSHSFWMLHLLFVLMRRVTKAAALNATQLIGKLTDCITQKYPSAFLLLSNSYLRI